MAENKTDLKNVAEKFAYLIANIAEDGNLESLSITIQGEGCDELLKLANQLGVKETTIIVHSVVKTNYQTL